MRNSCKKKNSFPTLLFEHFDIAIMFHVRRCRWYHVSPAHDNIKSLLVSRGFFESLPDNVVGNTKKRLTQQRIPNYVAAETRPQVLALCRQLHRAATKQMDPLCRHFLRVYIWESFAAYRHTTSKDHIRILIRDGNQHLHTLQRAAQGSDIKAVSSVMDTAFTKFKVSEGPLKRIMRSNRLSWTPAVAVHKLQAPKDIATYEEYFARSKAKKEFYFQFLAALKNGAPRLALGYNNSKVIFDPPREGTITGEQLPTARERNIIFRRMAQVLKTVRKPIDNSVMAYLEHMLVTTELNQSLLEKRFHQIKLQNQSLRFYRRRIMDVVEKVYTLHRDGDTLIAKVPDSTRIKTSAST